MKETIRQHYKDYPQAELQDLFKIIYQSEFGPGHIIEDRKKNFKRLMREFERTGGTTKENVVDFLPPRLCRLHLQILNQSTLSIHTLQRFFELSAEKSQGTIQAYHEKIESLRELCVDGDLPFDPEKVDQFKAKIDVSSPKRVRHSDTYRSAYEPVYRVVSKVFYEVLPLFARIDELMSQRGHVLVAIDGDCAAGKTTLATLLKSVYGCDIIHIDHFFLRPEQRHDARLAEPGGNIDHERFTEEVLNKLKTNKTFSYRPFNCMTGDFDAPISISTKKLTIIEGSYSHHPVLALNYDLKVFLSLPEEVQLARILKRNGDVMYEKFKSTWIPMEKWYAETLNIQKNSDLQFDDLTLI